MQPYAIKRAFIDGAIVRAEYPYLTVAQCIPRGGAGDVAYGIWWRDTAEVRTEDGVTAISTDFDMVLFLLMLGESMVHP